jgi:hypothetical protein
MEDWWIHRLLTDGSDYWIRGVITNRRTSGSRRYRAGSNLSRWGWRGVSGGASAGTGGPNFAEWSNKSVEEGLTGLSKFESSSIVLMM